MSKQTQNDDSDIDDLLDGKRERVYVYTRSAYP
jgi:hypothetical protein